MRTKTAGLSLMLAAMMAAVGLTQNCPPGMICGPGMVCTPPAVMAAPVVINTEPAEEVAVTADHPHVRCIMGNSCGSGTICGTDGRGAYVVTNAHVVGTQIGRQVAVDCVVGGAQRRVTGRTVMSGYSDRRMVDFAIVFVEGLSSARYMPMLKALPEAEPYKTTGSPRCVWPLVTKDFKDARSYGDGLITGTPNAIGGQSGSAIYNSRGVQIALLTWSIGGRCAGQKTIKLWEVATQRNVQLADPRPEGLRELSDCATGQRPQTSEGVFGDCVLFAAEETQADPRFRPVTENTIANEVGSDMEDLPIWIDAGRSPGSPKPEPEPEPEPDPPAEGDCMEVTPNERALIEFIRSQPDETRNGERAIDWTRLIPLIMQIIQIILESRGQ